MKTLTALIAVSRPKQLIKNLIVLVPLVFSGTLFTLGKVEYALLACLAFCCASAAVYTINDICDQEKDRAHPIKKDRPIARGALSALGASIWALFLIAISITISLLISAHLYIIVGFYILLVIAYSLWFKHRTLVDLISIALGFVLRVVAGIMVIDAVFSPWIISFTFFFAFFLASAKREAEYSLHAAQGIQAKRKVFMHYTVPYLQTLTSNTATIALVIYILYAALEMHTPFFLITALPILYGVYRFIWIIRSEKLSSDDPTDIFIKDKLLMLNVLLYTVLVIGILYLG